MSILAIPFPQIDPVAISLGPVSVKWYGLAYMAGLLLGWLYVRRLLAEKRLWASGRAPMSADATDDLLLWITFGVIVGGRLGAVLLFDPVYYFQNPWEIPAIWHGGMAFHGALAGSVLAMWIYSKRNSVNVWSVMDLCSAAVPIGLFFGRFANFINGELWGRASDVGWAMVFPGAGPAARHPSQLYEAFFEGIVLFVVLRVLTHHKLALRSPGLVAGVFLIGYGLARSFCELFREPDYSHALTFGPFTAGIMYSLPMIAIGLWFVHKARAKGTSRGAGKA